jgi:hypothetical protein
MRSSELGKDSKNGCACISIYINLFLALKPNGEREIMRLVLKWLREIMRLVLKWLQSEIALVTLTIYNNKT